MEVYQRRENLRFHRIHESSDTGDENTIEVLVEFMKKELEIERLIPSSFREFPLHKIGKKILYRGKPHQIIARFLRYPNIEKVMSAAKKLKGKKYGISGNLPKEIVDRRKELMSKFKKGQERRKYCSFFQQIRTR